MWSCNVSAHLHGDRGPVMQFCFMNLSQTSGSNGLVVECFKKLLRGFVEIF